MILENWEMANTAGKQEKGFWFRKIWVKANQLLITFAYHSSPLVYIYFMSRFKYCSADTENLIIPCYSSSFSVNKQQHIGFVKNNLYK